MIAICAFFIPDSPRWLLSKDREEEAIAALSRLRSQADFESGRCGQEIQTIRLSLQESVHKAPWTDLLRGTNFRRTVLVIVFYFFQQVCSIHLLYSKEVPCAASKISRLLWNDRPLGKLSCQLIRRPSTKPTVMQLMLLLIP